MHNIKSYGAVADGKTVCTAAIQSAIDACAAAGGGRVTVPAGTYKTGTIWLRSGIELHLELGAELLASENFDDYNAIDAYPQNFTSPVNEQWVGKHLIIAHEVENVAITGFGTINGNCHAFIDYVPVPPRFSWRSGMSVCKDKENLRPGQLIVFIECRNVRVHDITVEDATCWSLFFHGCEFVQVRGYKVSTPEYVLNSDGIDIDCCRYVTVSDCIIRVPDDGITIRCVESYLKNKNIHSEYITVTNCVIKSTCNAFRIGVGVGSIRHVQISNIVVERCLCALEFCTAYSKYCRADIEDVHVSGLSAVDSDAAFRLYAKNGASIRNISIENVHASSRMMNSIDCQNGSIDNVKMRDVEISVSDRFMKDQVDDWQFNFRGHHVLKVHGASRVVLDGLKMHGTLSDCDVAYSFTECDDIVKKDCVFTET